MSLPPTIRPAGDHSVLIELDGNDAVQRLAAGLEARRGSELEEIVPGHETLLLVWPSTAPAVSQIEELIAAADATAAATAPATEIELRVSYDGPDLETVAASCNCSPEELVVRHLACRYRVGFIGFSPGFAYLLGGDPALQPPRLAEPRTRVPAGALAIAGPYSAVYPRSSPGGWNLIGNCDEPIFDPAQNPPALLTAAMAVRLVAK